MNRRSSLLAALVLLAAAPLTRAEVKLPSILGSNMVLQRNRAVPLWGSADPSEKLTVRFDKTDLTTQADDKGQWTVKLPATPAGGPHTITITDSHGKATTLSDILFGEVWVCSGQSNMQFALAQAAMARQEIPAANHPTIRLFTVARATSMTPLDDVKGQWSPCEPKSVERFTAVGYYFGVELSKALNVPIGLIHSSWGGTPAEAWTSRPVLEKLESFKTTLANSDHWIARFDPEKAKAAYEKQLKQWEAVAAKARAEHKPAPRRPGYNDPRTDPHRPAVLFNAMIAPIVRFPIAGAIWYQGESNVGRAAQYYTLFPAMIQDWRAEWNQPEMPFYFVQIAPYHYSAVAEPYAELCDAQQQTMKTLPHTGMAVTNDVGNLRNIHPTDKKTVGHRLALWALSQTYGKTDLVYSGPIYKSFEVEGDKVRIRFDHTDGGLASRDGKPLSWFTLAGADHKFVPAVAEIDGQTVVVHADAVKSPVAVRFAWSQDAEPNLVNKAGLPASLFRTDSQPLFTANKN